MSGTRMLTRVTRLRGRITGIALVLLLRSYSFLFIVGRVWEREPKVVMSLVLL